MPTIFLDPGSFCIPRSTVSHKNDKFRPNHGFIFYRQQQSESDFFFFKLSFLINVKDTNVTHLLMVFLCDTGIPLPHMDVEVFDSFLHSYF